MTRFVTGRGAIGSPLPPTHAARDFGRPQDAVGTRVLEGDELPSVVRRRITEIRIGQIRHADVLFAIDDPLRDDRRARAIVLGAVLLVGEP